MANISFSKNDIITSTAQSSDEFFIIASGTVTVSAPGIRFNLAKGDVIGACEIGLENRIFNYMATEDTNLLRFSVDELFPLLNKQGEFSSYFFKSCIKQITFICEAYKSNLDVSSNIYGYVMELYSNYLKYCKDLGTEARHLDHLDEIQEFYPDMDINADLDMYYAELSSLIKDGAVFSPTFIECFMRKVAIDAKTLVLGTKRIFAYLTDLGRIILDEPGADMYGMFTEIYFLCSSRAELQSEVGDTLDQISSFLDRKMFINPNRYIERTGSFERRKERSLASSNSSNFDVKIFEELDESLEQLINFGQLDYEDACEVRRTIDLFKHMDDMAGSSDDSRRLRMDVARLFYLMYEKCAIRVLSEYQDSEQKPPHVVTMFLEFGYMDEELCSRKDLTFMYQKAGTGYTSPNTGIYTFFEWLTAIYKCEKMPLKNELDVDFADYINERKRYRTLNDDEALNLLNDGEARVKYEIRNCFQAANKATNGRISAFVPVFVSANIYKSLSETIVTAKTVRSGLEYVIGRDYSIFYRESLYRNDQVGIGNVLINKEVLPDVILMPNAGCRGLMWQEIQGRARNTPAAIMLPIFDQDDCKRHILRACAEFRWEMCKRVQGLRWNDVTDLSLTSEYFDYVQFYRKNHSLSPEVKEKVKVALQRAKNSYKEMFINDYITWVMNEHDGSPRLNKYVRGIFSRYCPFTTETRRKLLTNPNFAEYIEKFEIKNNQNVHRIEMIIQRISNAGMVPPDEIINEREFLRK